MNNEEKLIDRIIHDFLDLDLVESIEILCPFEEEYFAKMLKDSILDKNIFITYTNGPIQKEIEKDYRRFLDDRIAFYRARIHEKFTRITILSPFPTPIALTDNVSKYRNCIHELEFVNEYLANAQRCIVVKPNTLWAHKLNIELDELWSIINELYDKKSRLNERLDYINSLDIRSISFKTKEGTDISFSIDENTYFNGKYLKINGIKFVGNAPSLEIYIAPNKFSGNGKIVFTKPFYFRNKKIENHSIILKNGRVASSIGLDDLFKIDDSLLYVGEVAIAENYDFVFQNNLLDENTGCHIGLGMAYPYNVGNMDNVNKSNYHYDLIFGSDSICVSVKDKYGNDISIMVDGMVVI